MATRRSIARFRQPERKRPADWEPDLGPSGADDEDPPALRASEVEELRRMLTEFSEDELENLPVLGSGTRLHQGKTYLDLKDPRRKPFTPTGEIRAQAGHWYVLKDQAPRQQWNRLIGLRELKQGT